MDKRSNVVLVRPTVRRVLVSISAVAAASCAIAGVCLFIAALVTDHNDPSGTSGGDYVRLFIWFVLLYGPGLLLICWPVSVPTIAILAALAASLRRTSEPDPAHESTSDTTTYEP